MANLIPWSTVEIGDLNIFTPMLPSLVVYTWYVDDQPESTITYFWRDEDTGMIHQEHLVVAPLTFEEAVTKAQEEAPKRGVDRIHVKHARSSTKPGAKAKRATKAGATRLKKRVPAKRKPARRSRSA